MAHVKWARVGGALAVTTAVSFGACAGDESSNAGATTGGAGVAAITAGATSDASSVAGAAGPAPGSAGVGSGAAGAPVNSGNAGAGGTQSAGIAGSDGGADSGAAPVPDASPADDASTSGPAADAQVPDGPREYGARGPHEVAIEKNVGESHRNTGLTDDAARCAALVGGLGDDADGGDWSIYPEDMDRQLYTLFRPVVLEEGVTYPVITWGNGTCSQPLLFEPLLGHLASHGFIVIASNWRWVAGGVEMQRALDFVLAENERPESMLFGKIATDRLGASGHSQGSTATVTVGADERIVATVPIQGASADGVRQLKGPTFLIAGDEDTTVSASSVESAFRAATVPAVYGLSIGIDHVVPVMMPQPILAAVTAWFRIHLADDQHARPLFYDTCSLCIDPTWEIQSANL